MTGVDGLERVERAGNPHENESVPPSGGAYVAETYGWMLFLLVVASALATPARAQDDEAAELAKKLAKLNSPDTVKNYFFKPPGYA